MARKQTSGGKQLLLRIVIPLIVVVITTVVLFFLGHERLAVLVSNCGSILIIIGAPLYVVLTDSKSRWPNLSVSKRFMKVITYSR